MGMTVRARVRNGKLELAERIDLPEGTEVAVTIADGPAPKDFTRFLRSAGSWRGVVNADKLVRHIYRDRLISTRKRPRL